MANNDIKQRIVLEGEKEYSSAIRTAQRNLKTLRSELKAETAELGNNATAQEKNRIKAKNLQQQIKEQEKVVKAQRDALEEVRKKYGDNDEAIAKYEQRLNSARATLANLQNSLDAIGNSYDEISNGAKKSAVENNALAESFHKISDVANSVASGLESIFSGITSTIKATIGAVWGELTQIAAKADNYMDLAAYFGSSATEVQKWDSAMKAAAGDMSTVTSLITKLKYSGKEKNVAEWFGISAENYTDDLLYFQAVMSEMAASRDEMLANGTWNTAMVDIFGNKKGMDVEGVLSDWDNILKGLDKFDADKDGYGPSEEDLKNMAQLNVQIETLRESWQKLKEMATIQLFGDLAIRITGNLQNILDAFKDYLTADNDYAKKAALDTIKRNIKEMFYAVRDAIQAGIEILNDLAQEFKNSDDPAAQTFGNILESIKNIIEWLADPSHWEDIRKGIEIVLGAWLFMKLASVANTVSGLVSNLQTIFSYKGGSGTASGVASGAASSGVSGVGSGAATAGGAGVKTGFFSNAASKITASGAGKALLTGGMGTLISAAMFYGIAKLASSGNIDVDIAADYSRFSDNENKDTIQAGARGLLGLRGSDTSNAEWQLNWMAANLGYKNFFDTFNYTDAKRGDSNLLVDLLGMNDENIMAAVYKIWEHTYGAENSERGAAAWASLTDEQREALYGARDVYQARELLGIETTYGELLTYLQDYFRKSGTYNEFGQWVVPSEWWSQQTQSNDTMKQMVDDLPGNLSNAMSGVRVYMDGETVGRLVTPYVSEGIARDVP